MSWKKFLKPDWRKIIVFIFLFLISSSYRIDPKGINDYFYEISIEYYFWGLPIPFYSCMFLEEYLVSPLTPSPICNIAFELLIPNLIFWYLTSCLIVWIYDKFRKVKKK
ncbi:hypothetical protein A3K64_02280 [Candidatus Micrarchaeota archaeon RBG_16_36_9]|nr:MAG: hypothetical protein A3K64_02280 [Candidatus Micrarchaeota archaeon RBG_16_36_9]